MTLRRERTSDIIQSLGSSPAENKNVLLYPERCPISISRSPLPFPLILIKRLGFFHLVLRVITEAALFKLLWKREVKHTPSTFPLSYLGFMTKIKIEQPAQFCFFVHKMDVKWLKHDVSGAAGTRGGVYSALICIVMNIYSSWDF